MVRRALYPRRQGTRFKRRESRKCGLTRSDVSPWTDEEISTLIRLWPTQSAMQIANALLRSRSAIRSKAQELCKKGLLEGKNALRGQSIKPDAQDFDEVKTDYCRTHHITMAELGARFESGHQLAAELYRLAIAANLSRLGSRPGASSAATNGPGF